MLYPAELPGRWCVFGDFAYLGKRVEARYRLCCSASHPIRKRFSLGCNRL
jgi:hypothetical protein